MARNRDDDPIVDADDFLRLAGRGTVIGLAVFAFSEITDGLAWPFWLRLLVASAVAVVLGVVWGLVRRACVRRRTRAR